MNLTRNAT